MRNPPPPASLPTILLERLEAVTGGVRPPQVCTPENPRGAPTHHEVLTRPTGNGKSIAETVVENTDRAMAPWKLLNGIAGGARTAGNLPAYQPPPGR